MFKFNKKKEDSCSFDTKTNNNNNHKSNLNIGDEIIKVSNLSYSYGNDKIFYKASFSIKKGDLVAIVGPNGAGKSTLAKLLVGLLDFKNKKERNKHIKINGKIAYIPQKFNQDSNFPAKVSEILELECCICNHSKDILKSLDISSLENKQFKDLSGGQQQRVLIALALLSNPDVLILDEPTVGIDSKTQDSFYNILSKLNKNRNLTILFVTHDTSMISNYFSNILCVFDKHIIYDDAKNSHSILHGAYGCSFHEIKHNHINRDKKREKGGKKIDEGLE